MSGVIIKDSPTRKITHPTDDPMWSRKKKIAEKRIREGKMTFSTESEERDYNARVSANKFNVKGLPAWYPAETLSSSLIGVRPAIECECGGCCTAQDDYICPKCGKVN
jgi:hypothetical protein